MHQSTDFESIPSGQLKKYHAFFRIKQTMLNFIEILQWTINVILLLTVGGIPFEAIHKYEPICILVTRWNVNVGLSTTGTWMYKLNLIHEKYSD